MGLDAYLHYQCNFRPGGDYLQIQQAEQAARALTVMQQHGVPSVTLRVNVQGNVTDKQITRAEAEHAMAGLERLTAACSQCPAAVVGSAPACRARVSYPIDDVALAVLHEALALNAASFEGEESLYITSLVQAGHYNGQRMDAVIRSLQEAPGAIGHTPVVFHKDGQSAQVTPYMLLEHTFFRPFLDPPAVHALREWLRSYYRAIGERMMAGPHEDNDANAAALFGSSPSLQELAAFGKLVKAANELGLGLMLDG